MNKAEAVEAATWAKAVGLQKVRTRNTAVGYVVTCENPRGGGDLHSESLSDLKAWRRRYLLAAEVTA